MNGQICVRCVHILLEHMLLNPVRSRSILILRRLQPSPFLPPSAVGGRRKEEEEKGSFSRDLSSEGRRFRRTDRSGKGRDVPFFA